MTVSSSTSTTDLINSLNGSSSASSATSSAMGDIQSTFLKLLTTQLQNQDPMNPLDNAEMTSQLAQMSTAQGISNLNTTLNSLMNMYQSSQTLQAASLIGHTVLADGDTLALSSGQAVGGVELGSAADAVTVQITDANGNTVRTLNLGQQSSGQVGFSWDGTDNNGAAVADGNYNFKVTATSNGTQVDATPLAVATVSSVSLNGSTVTVNTSNSGQLDLSQIYRIF